MFESFRAKFQFQLRFKDRVNAANIVAAALSDRLSKEERTNACVLGIPRGGVIVADVVASKLQTNNFQIIVPRKLTVLHNEELAFGAVMLDGMTYLNDDLDVPSEYVEIEKTRQIQEIRRRMQLYLATDNMNYLDSSKLDNTATVILVDDGVASGATFIAAARWLRKIYHPNKIIVAATVAPKESIKIMKDEQINEIEVIAKPQSSNFNFVG
jgi:putative phosphoribosyl transferase